jgi:hypothetical protein
VLIEIKELMGAGMGSLIRVEEGLRRSSRTGEHELLENSEFRYYLLSSGEGKEINSKREVSTRSKKISLLCDFVIL